MGQSSKDIYKKKQCALLFYVVKFFFWRYFRYTVKKSVNSTFHIYCNLTNGTFCGAVGGTCPGHPGTLGWLGCPGHAGWLGQTGMPGCCPGQGWYGPLGCPGQEGFSGCPGQEALVGWPGHVGPPACRLVGLLCAASVSRASASWEKEIKI